MSDDGGAAASTGGGMPKAAEYFGWVYHLGVNAVGLEYCHLRFLHVKGKHALMFKRDPHDFPDIKPIRKGVINHTLMVEDLGRRKVNNGDLYVLRLYNRLDETQKGELACAEPGDVQKWMEAFDQAKQQADCDLLRGRSRQRLNVDNELNFDGHRPRVRRNLRNLVRIGKGPEVLLRQASDLGSNARVDTYFSDVGDAINIHGWRPVHILNGIRIFEDATESKKGSFLVKSVGMIDGSLDAVFEAILNLDKHKRYEWDVLTADLELVDTVDGHYDVVHGIYNPKYLSRWHSKTDFVFSRQWFRSQDGSYTILQSPAVHKKCPKLSGYRRMKINPSTWEIRKLDHSHSSNATKCIVTQMLEIHCSFWDRLKKFNSSNFEKTIPYAMLCQVAGLKEYFAAHPTVNLDLPSTVVHSTSSSVSGGSLDFEDSDGNDEFYDAILDNGLLKNEDSSDDDDFDMPKHGTTKLRNVSWALAALALRRRPASAAISELDTTVPPVVIDPNQFHGSLNQARDDAERNCWSSPSGRSFMVRGKTYSKDFTKVLGGDPLLKLIAVDWLKSDNALDKIALYPKCLLQVTARIEEEEELLAMGDSERLGVPSRLGQLSEEGKKLPFVLVINLQIPAKPNLNLVLYYSAERPICKKSLLGKFVHGTDQFRDARFKLIPSIVQGYWMVKRAVGTKACLLGKAVTCRYIQQDNFLEIDVDIGSSSVARSVISLVLGYVTSIVVDLAILIEGKEENELPEYILGAVRLSCLKPETAAQL